MTVMLTKLIVIIVNNYIFIPLPRSLLIYFYIKSSGTTLLAKFYIGEINYSNDKYRLFPFCTNELIRRGVIDITHFIFVQEAFSAKFGSCDYVG